MRRPVYFIRPSTAYMQSLRMENYYSGGSESVNTLFIIASTSTETVKYLTILTPRTLLEVIGLFIHIHVCALKLWLFLFYFFLFSKLGISLNFGD